MGAGVKGPLGNNSKHGGLFAKIGATIVKLCGFGKGNDNGKTGIVAGAGAPLTAGKGKGGIGSDADARTGAGKPKGGLVAGAGTGAVVIGSGKHSGKTKGEYAEGRAQLVEKSESRRNALETELKKAEELAASQRSALEAKLKSAEERAQLAEKNADLATSQRIRIEAELKKAQEKAQLAQKITDIVSQSRAEEKGVPNREPSQKGADLSANKPKSGQTEPLNAGLTPEPKPSTQPADSSVKAAQTTARSGPAPVRAQAVADTPREANNGISSTEATAPIAVGASPTPISELAVPGRNGD
jgi:hypothetical protein